jgi:hypothetical protein
VSFAVLGVFNPRAPYNVNDKGVRVHLSDGMGQPPGN